MSVLLYLGKSTASESLWVKFFQTSLGISGKSCISPSCISSPRSISRLHLVEWRLLGFPEFSSSRHSSLMPYCKRSCYGCFGRQGAHGTAMAVFNPLAAQRYLLHRQGLSSSVNWAVGEGNLSIYKKGLSTVLERKGRLMSSRRCIKQYHIGPKLADFVASFI